MPTTSRVDELLDDAQEGVLDAGAAVREMTPLVVKLHRLLGETLDHLAESDAANRELRALELRAKTGPRRALAETTATAAAA